MSVNLTNIEIVLFLVIYSCYAIEFGDYQVG